MKREKETPVIFRKFQNKTITRADVIALFPTLPGTNDASTCANYMHIGQHGAANVSISRYTKPASPEEYADLLAELTRIGYRVRVIRRFSPAHYAARVHSLNVCGLDDFTRAYLRAALWTGYDDAEKPLDESFAIEDFTPEAIDKARSDCAEFQRVNAALLAVAYERYTLHADAPTPQHCAGHDYWLTRNGHGVGFWDRKELDADQIGERLSTAAKDCGECYVYVGDSGRVCLA